jgi:hypothetical protein
MPERTMSASTLRVIATRELFYTERGGTALKRFHVRISEPYLLTEELSDIPFCEGAASCVINFDLLPEADHVVTGVDTFQALELAVSSAEKHLQRLRRKYDFYFEPGVPYFDK